MEINLTRTKALVTLVALALLVFGMLAKRRYFPSVDERDFQLDYERLRIVPANVLALRLTRFNGSTRTGCLSFPVSDGPNKYLPRMVGRDVDFGQIMAAAYQCQLSRVILPPGCPTNHYDFLDTMRQQPVEQLQAAVKRKLGYVAYWQNHETAVWDLKVLRADTPGLKASYSGSEYIQFWNGQLHFGHVTTEQLGDVLEVALNKPVEDQTDLSGTYDFSIPWNGQGSHAMDPSSVKNSLGELGLTIAPDTDSMKMLMVEPVK